MDGKIIVLRVSPDEWKVAEWRASDQLGNGPMVGVYELAPGPAYRSERQALEDARLILARLR